MRLHSVLFCCCFYYIQISFSIPFELMSGTVSDSILIVPISNVLFIEIIRSVARGFFTRCAG
jgi:hypothetical protein